VQVAGAHVAPVQQRMIVPLHGNQFVARHVLARDEPRRGKAFARAADPKALPLAHRVIGEPVVPADRRALRSDDRTRCSREVPREEIAKRPLADETDACRIAFRVRRDVLTLRECAHVAFHHFAQRKDDGCELRLRQPMQEVRLVLRAVDGLDELGAIRATRPPHARVMAGRDPIGAQRDRVIEEGAELDFAIAQHVGVGRATGGVIVEEMGEHALAILGGEIHRFELDADDVGHGRCIDEILARRAVFVGVVVLPVLHEETDDVIPLRFQQPRSDRRVDATGHADDDAFPARHQRFAITPSGQRVPAR